MSKPDIWQIKHWNFFCCCSILNHDGYRPVWKEWVARQFCSLHKNVWQVHVNEIWSNVIIVSVCGRILSFHTCVRVSSCCCYWSTMLKTPDTLHHIQHNRIILMQSQPFLLHFAHHVRQQKKSSCTCTIFTACSITQPGFDPQSHDLEADRYISSWAMSEIIQ